MKIKDILIAHRGIEWYEAYKAKRNAYTKERYNNDAEYKEERNVKMREQQRKRYHNDDEFKEAYKLKMRERYCRIGEFERIENYELAKADNFKGWDIHHRLELTVNGEYAHSIEELKRMDMYYNRPYFELIFLRHNEHMKLHKGK